MKVFAVASLAVLLGVSTYAQTSPLSVNVQGTVFDRSEPPGPTKSLSEPLAARLIFSPDSSQTGFNIVLFADGSQSALFKMFEYPGKAIDTADTHVPPNAFPFYGTVQDGRVVGDLLAFTGRVATPDGQRSYLYTGSWDNPIIGGFDPMPVYSWDYISDGTTGNGDNLACEPAKGPLPAPGFIAVIERGTCLFTDKVYNAALAGAYAVVVFNHQAGGDTFIPQMATPGVSIPSVFLRRADGLDLLTYADDNRSGPGKVEIDPVNLLGSIIGSYTVDGNGQLSSVNLSFYMSDWGTSIFAGTITR